MAEIANQNKTEHDPVDVATIGGRKVFVKREHAEKKKSREILANFTSLSNPNGVFTQSSQYIDYEVNSDRVHVIKKMALRFDVSNVSSPSIDIQPVVGPYLIEKIELYLGSSLIATHYDNHLYTEFLLMNDGDRLRQLASGMGMSVPRYDTVEDNTLTWDAGTTDATLTGIPDFIANQSANKDVYKAGPVIAAGGTREYLIPIQSWINQSDFFLPASIQRIRVRVYFRGGSGIFGAGGGASGDLELQSSQLLVSGVKYDNDILQQLMNRYRSVAHLKRCIIPRQQLINYGLQSTSVVQQLSLTGISGTMSHLVWFEREAGVSGDNYTDFNPLTKYTLLSSDGSPDGFPDITDQFNRCVMIPHARVPCGAAGIAYQDPALTDQSLAIYVHPFSHDVPDSYWRANNNGSQFVNGLWTLQPQLNANQPPTNPGNTGTMVVLAYQHANLIQNTDGSTDVLYV